MISYDVKANITTLVSTYLIPVLVACGVSVELSNAIVGVIVAVIMIVCGMLNERYTSKHLTVEPDEEDYGFDSEIS